MALFQTTVVQKYLKAQDQSIINEKWETYKAHFHNPSIQENIRNAKEEQYQEGFLRDLFVNVLGYTLNPETDFNLTTELKNVKDAKKVDGAILSNSRGLNPLGSVIGVIELKGTDTTDLSKVESQAFGYKNNQKNCTYVITSNFEKLRFYIDNAIEHQAFDLFQLTEKDFKLLYLCLAYENISKDIPKKLKNESLSQEDVVTKQLYKDYSLFKRELFNNLTELNPDIDPLLLFKKSQKLLDRFLFLFFAEDRHLLPPNSVRLVLKQWKQLKELDAYSPLYSRYKKYFGYLNTGHKGKKYDVYPYNGGLFKLDDILDNVKINDDLLYKHTLKLSEYDFDSEVDVNILGHIFENSLNEIEEIQTQLEKNKASKGFQPLAKVSKRKKDGVFYTPKYITKYIVENTVGKLCEEQKESLNIVEEEYNNKRQKKTKETLLEKLKTYRQWLLELTICDPACGSGAFLNEALNYLIAEHQYVDELETKLMGGGFVFPNVENSILENNLFGVDINNESVEIAKLSLWLRTAQPNRKLNDLSHNIKCGNSLIDNPEVAGDKAFSWEKEFPKVFKEKDKHAFHLVFTTHNSRISQRMLKYKIETGAALELNLDQEIALTQIICDLTKEQNYNILAYNICKDHVHLIVVCEEEEVPQIAKTIKGKSSHQFQSKGFKPLGKPLWSQKYFFARMEDLSLPNVSQKPGRVFVDSYLDNAINYVESNRSKHQLPESNKLRTIIAEMCCTADEAFATEYKGGFDVVIGNPPYVRQELIQDYIPVLKTDYSSFAGKADLYVYFYELATNIGNRKSLTGFISSGKFLEARYGTPLLDYLVRKTSIHQIIDFKDLEVFEGISAYPLILIFENTISNKKEFSYKDLSIYSISEIKNLISDIDFDLIVLEDFIKNGYTFISKKVSSIIKKLNYNCKTLSELNLKPLVGIKTGYNEGYLVANSNYSKNYSFGKNIKRYSQIRSEEKIFFPYLWEHEYVLIERDDKELEYIRPNKERLGKRAIIKDGLKKGTKTWYEYQQINKKLDFEKEFIVYPNVSLGNNFTLSKGNVIDMTGFIIESNSKFLLTILNSRITSFLMSIYAISRRGGYLEYKTQYLDKIPLKEISNHEQTPYIQKAEEIIALNIRLQDLMGKFKRSLQREFPEALNKLPRKLQNWYELSFADFVKALNKKLKSSKGFKPLGLKEKAEWEDYFLAEQQKALDLKVQINAIDKEIDQMVYALYGLTEEEIKIVEES